MLNTAAAGVKQIEGHLLRISTLAVSARNGTNTIEDVNSMQAEVKQRLAEINQIAAKADFNGIKILSDNREVRIQIGEGENDHVKFNLNNVSTDELKISNIDLSIFNKAYVDYGTTAATVAELQDVGEKLYPGYAGANTALDAAEIKVVDGGASGVAANAALGNHQLHQKIDAATGEAIENKFVFKEDGTNKVFEVDLDFKIAGAAGNSKQTLELTIGKEITDAEDGLVGQKATRNGVVAADQVMETINKAQAKLLENNSDFGALLNRLNSTLETLSSSSTELATTMSSIMNADLAAEVANLSINQMLSQAGISVLGKSNQNYQSMLSLFQAL